MIDAKLVRSKLEACSLCLVRLQPLARIPYAKFSTDYVVSSAAERLVQLVVDAAVDVNNHLLLEAGQPTPRDYFSSFMGLVRIRALSSRLARSLARTTGLRNRLVHAYEEIDPALFYRSLPELLRHFRAYVASIRGFAGC